MRDEVANDWGCGCDHLGPTRTDRPDLLGHDHRERRRGGRDSHRRHRGSRVRCHLRDRTDRSSPVAVRVRAGARVGVGVGPRSGKPNVEGCCSIRPRETSKALRRHWKPQIVFLTVSSREGIPSTRGKRREISDRFAASTNPPTDQGKPERSRGRAPTRSGAAAADSGIRASHRAGPTSAAPGRLPLSSFSRSANWAAKARRLSSPQSGYPSWRSGCSE